jgi:hypothetical protein
MKITLILLLFLTVIYIFLWVPTFLTLYPKYKFYKKTYLALKNKQYVLSTIDDSFITFKPKDKIQPTGTFGFAQWQFDNDEILYFKYDQTIKLSNFGYIHKDLLGFDPYTLYWHRKIKKQILLDSRTKAQIRQDNLNKLI